MCCHLALAAAGTGSLSGLEANEAALARAVDEVAHVTHICPPILGVRLTAWRTYRTTAE